MEEQGEEEDEEEDWSRMDGEVVTVELQQNDYGLGLSLAGAKVGTLRLHFTTRIPTL